jgi:SAM-dependent methyltransferase
MEKNLYEQFEEIHTDHWWFRGRLKILNAVFQNFLKPPAAGQNFEILDVGCGTGSYFEILGKYGKVSGTESSPEVIKTLRARGVNNEIFLAELPNMNLRKKFDCVTAFEIIEHVEEDEASLRNIADHLKPDGLLIGTVPAYRWLWSPHDDLAHHKRRYTRPELIEKLKRAGFTAVKISYYNTFLFPIAVLVRFLKKTLLKKMAPVSDFSVSAGPLDAVFEKVFAAERWWLNFFNFPFGFSLLFIARK